MRLYRVLYYNQNVAPAEQGGVLYVPPQGPNRIDNPQSYQALYVGDSRAGVCAEVFYRGRYRQAWTDQMLRPLPSGDRRVLAWYELPGDASLCDLDDPSVLIAMHLRPSQVITRDYAISQAWALRIFNRGQFAGVRWWSYCDARWSSIGLWDRSGIRDYGFEELSLEHPAIQEAARVLDVHVRS